MWDDELDDEYVRVEEVEVRERVALVRVRYCGRDVTYSAGQQVVVRFAGDGGAQVSRHFCGKCGAVRVLHPWNGCEAFEERQREPVRVHVFGTGPERRADLFLRGNGEHGSGGQLRRMKLEDLRAVAEVVARTIEIMEHRGGTQ